MFSLDFGDEPASIKEIPTETDEHTNVMLTAQGVIRVSTNGAGVIVAFRFSHCATTNV